MPPENDAEAVFSPDDPVIEINAEPPPEATPEPLEAAPEPDAEEPEQPKPKDAIKRLTGRIGHLTRITNEKDAKIAEQASALESAMALLAAQGKDPDAKPAQQPVDVETRAQQIADKRLFDEACNKVYAEGQALFKDEFAANVASLQAMNFTSRDLVEGAIETGSAPAILNYLGQDLDEAERISSLTPAKMGAALAKLAAKLGEKTHSSAPAPIKPLGGTGKVEPDIYDPDISEGEYIARRAKQGAWWAQPDRGSQ